MLFRSNDTTDEYALNVYLSNIIKKEVIGQICYIKHDVDSVFVWSIITKYDGIIGTDDIIKNYPKLYDGIVYNYFKERDLINKILDRFRRTGLLYLPN